MMTLPPVSWGDAIPAVGLLVVVLFFVFKNLFARIDTVDKGAASAQGCDERHRHIEQDLEQGRVKFKELQDELKANTQTLTRVETKIEILLKANGGGHGP